MALPNDALTSLAPPPPTAEPVVDATLNPEKDKRHLRFEEIKKLADTDPNKIISLEALIQENNAAGHNPRAPNDVMFEILGISPEFLEGLLFSLRNQAKMLKPANAAGQPAQQPQAQPAAEATPAPANEAA